MSGFKALVIEGCRTSHYVSSSSKGSKHLDELVFVLASEYFEEEQRAICGYDFC
jgi:hypothetical protein